ncbi:MAG TPA: DUF2007 domain-containing protein [Bacteroidales bacterium]|nr:DUF2007 domain-containing protein [Bacteroidales bacterium]HPS46352.1 DUF2007 domain-containing protein [Bacteroidales bacterium]HQH18543.1 DUF2007 domain-containing protein [Bacteroidales bacterium]HQI44622.1 DUF2007 domain-containing protein [Bacteroidales bacterium]
MNEQWVSIYNSNYNYLVEITQAILTENEIESVIVNKQDSSYHFGIIELHVHPDNVIKALQIINTEKL